ncbi:MAG: hypothetical protein B6I37_05445 [Desulfobacteraceae bacterium 4572_35.2]|nr:MAG: hypothetical protein B6I37_05445 [Desulfobacteraceae bacterium 4572_35.2]
MVCDFDWRCEPWKGLAGLFALAARCTEQRDIDIDDETQRKISAKMREAKVLRTLLPSVTKIVKFSSVNRYQRDSSSSIIASRLLA